jgi:hypothetical protein
MHLANCSWRIDADSINQENTAMSHRLHLEHTGSNEPKVTVNEWLHRVVHEHQHRPGANHECDPGKHGMGHGKEHGKDQDKDHGKEHDKDHDKDHRRRHRGLSSDNPDELLRQAERLYKRINKDIRNGDLVGADKLADKALRDFNEYCASAEIRARAARLPGGLDNLAAIQELEKRAQRAFEHGNLKRALSNFKGAEAGLDETVSQAAFPPEKHHAHPHKKCEMK